VLPARLTSAPSESGDVARARLATVAGPVRVLLVEDDPEVLSTLREQMLMSGWSVVPAQDGQTALTLLSADPGITILVTDVMMPGGMSGVELAHRAARARGGLPILLVSGYPGAALEEAGADVHEFDLLHKPFSQQELIERVLGAIAAQRGVAAQAHARG
jgi:DNA-binding response OmpR family regulator